MITWIIFTKPPLGGRSNTKPVDHGTPNAHNRWFILFYHLWGPARIEIHWNNIQLRAQFTYDFIQHLRVCDHITWFWRCVRMAFWTLPFGLSQFHGHGSLRSCGKWPSRSFDMNQQQFYREVKLFWIVRWLRGTCICSYTIIPSRCKLTHTNINPYFILFFSFWGGGEGVKRIETQASWVPCPEPVSPRWLVSCLSLWVSANFHTGGPWKVLTSVIRFVHVPCPVLH